MRLLLAVLLLGATPPLDMRTINDGLPPSRYMGNDTVTVRFVDEPNAADACGVAAKGFVILACTLTDGTIILPNPCRFSTEEYGKRLCHENGHVRGWNRTHDN